MKHIFTLTILSILIFSTTAIAQTLSDECVDCNGIDALIKGRTTTSQFTLLPNINGISEGFVLTAVDVDGTAEWRAPATGIGTVTSLWQLENENLYTLRKVGIGTGKPEAHLHVVGTAIIEGRTITSDFTLINSNNPPQADWVLTSDNEGNARWAPRTGGTGTESPWLRNDDDDIYFTTGIGLDPGKVGIGVSNPSYTLHVNGDAYTKDLTVDGSIKLMDKLRFNTQNAEVNWGASTSSGYGKLTFKAYNGISPDDPNKFQSRTIMTINGSTENVGIGTTSPLAKLHVDGDIALKSEIKFETSAAEISWGSNDMLFKGYKDDGQGTGIYTIMALESESGNVGIGTTSPKAKLHVDGDIALKSEIKFITSEAEIIWGSNNMLFKGYNDGIQEAGFYTIMALDANSGNVGIGTTSPQAKLHVNGTTLTNSLFTENIKITTGFSEGAVLISDDEGYGRWRQLEVPKRLWTASENSDNIYRLDGNVGIGTDNTGDYKLAVNGSINAKLIKVSENVPGADYVFKEDYKLMPLYELEEFVNRNHHLPEVKSAKEFKEEGYNLGDMDDVLLRKVEELTLYIIEQQKQLDKQQQLINDLLLNQDNNTTQNK